MARSRVGAHKGEKIISSGAPSGHRRARAMSPIPYLARFARKVSLAPSPRSHHRLAHFARTIACCSQARKLASSTPRLLSSLTTLLASLALLARTTLCSLRLPAALSPRSSLASLAAAPCCMCSPCSLRSPLARFARLLPLTSLVPPSFAATPPRQKVGDFRLHGIRMKESAHSDARIVKNHPGFT